MSELEKSGWISYALGVITGVGSTIIVVHLIPHLHWI